MYKICTKIGGIIWDMAKDIWQCLKVKKLFLK